jgi:hypothetical protein
MCSGLPRFSSVIALPVQPQRYKLLAPAKH